MNILLSIFGIKNSYLDIINLRRLIKLSARFLLWFSFSVYTQYTRGCKGEKGKV